MRLLIATRVGILRAGLAVVVIGAAVLASAGPASAYSRGFHIYNFTHYPVQYGKSLGGTFDSTPPQDKILQPGAYDDFEVTFFLGDNNTPKVWYRILGGYGAQFVITLRVHVFGDITSSCSVESTTTAFQCAARGTDIRLLDPLGTKVTVGAGERQAQADSLRHFCEPGNAAECKFEPTSEEFLSGLKRGQLGVEPHDVLGAVVYNSTDHVEAHKTVKVEDTDGWSNTLGVELEASFKLGKAVELGIKGKYEHEWHHDHTFSDELTVTIPEHSVVWITSVSPIVHYRGTMIVKLGNTTWTLPDVGFNFPWPDGHPLWIINESKFEQGGAP